MKIIDQYIYAIGKKLPYSNKEDIKLELYSLVWDDIENKYGNEPTEDQVKEIIKAWGPPSKVANQYRNDRYVIGNGFTDLYFLIIKIMLFAMTIAFTVVFVVELFQNEITNTSVATGLTNILLNIINTMLPGIGALTLIFIIITRIYKEEIIDLDENWTPNDLKDIQIGPKIESIFENFFSILFLIIALVIINFTPQLITIAEKIFEVSGLKLGHYIDIQNLKFYLIFISIAWFMQIIYHILLLFTQQKTKGIAAYDIVVELVSFIVMLSIVLATNLYTNYTSILGFRGLFLIITIINGIEIITKSISYVKNHIL